jgi:hypothetical protein
MIKKIKKAINKLNDTLEEAREWSSHNKDSMRQEYKRYMRSVPADLPKLTKRDMDGVREQYFRFCKCGKINKTQKSPFTNKNKCSICGTLNQGSVRVRD